MFSRSRYVVIDDDADQLRVLIETLHFLGAPCRGIHFDPKAGLKPDDLHGIRILFLDLNLNATAIAANKADYGLIASLLDAGIDPASGPYILILWTSHAAQLEDFSTYLRKALAPEKMPLTTLALDKKEYLVGGNANVAKLRADIEASIKENPRLQALLQWEHDVLSAAGATLAELGNLIPVADRTPEKFSDSLDAILSRLAAAAVGQKNAERDPRSAVNGALAPILADRIANSPAAAGAEDLWKQAVTQADNPIDLSPEQAGRMNALIHLAIQGSEVIAPADWGAVVKVPGVDDDAAMEARFGMRRGALINDVFQIGTKPHRAKCSLVLVRAGAVCDYAKGRKGPISYILGLIRPLSAARAERARLGGDFVSPVLFLDGGGEPFELITSGAFLVSVADSWLDGAEVPFRIRESLLMQLASSAATYSVRPGILEFRASEEKLAAKPGLAAANAEPASKPKPRPAAKAAKAAKVAKAAPRGGLKMADGAPAKGEE